MHPSPAVDIVIGGASGIGWATAQLMAARGDTVIIAGHNREAAADRAAELGASAEGHYVEVTDEAGMRALFDTIHAAHGRIDHVVDCAGVAIPGLLAELSLHDWNTNLNVGLTGAFLTIRESARTMRDGGSVVLVASLNGRQPGRALGAYSAAKAGMLMLTQVAAMELGPAGIRVNAVSPGFVHTKLTQPMHEIPGLVEQYLDNTPLGRLGNPQDIAATIGFLASESASWITGATIDINGGAHTQRYPNGLEKLAP